MNELLDKLSYTAKISTDLLFVRNPIATSMGVFFGVIVHGVVGLLAPFAEFANKVASSAINIAHYIAVGVFCFNLKGFLNKDKVPEQVTEGIEFIKQQETEGRITKTEARIKYRVLIDKYIENVSLDVSTASKVSSITDTLKK